MGLFGFGKKKKKDEISVDNDFEEYYFDEPPEYTCDRPNCPQCGEVMWYSYDKSSFKCPTCGFTMDEDEFDCDMTDEDGMPWVCSTCGGPWPDCQASCKIFDD